jgi:hypothetical protein
MRRREHWLVYGRQGLSIFPAEGGRLPAAPARQGENYMILTAIHTEAGSFHVHQTGCPDIARSRAQHPDRDVRELGEVASQADAIDALWGDAASNYVGRERVLASCAAETHFIWCTRGLPR